MRETNGGTILDAEGNSDSLGADSSFFLSTSGAGGPEVTVLDCAIGCGGCRTTGKACAGSGAI